MRYRLIIAFIGLLSSVAVNAQLNEVVVAPKMETESYSRVLKHNNEIYFFRRVKSKEITVKAFLLTKYSADGLTQIWETEVELEKFHNVFNFTCINDHLQIYATKHDLDEMRSKISVYQYDLDGGKRSLGKTLGEDQIGVWAESFGKGSVAQTFYSAVDSKQNENDVTPLEYRFGLEFSQDSSRIAVYRYDNSQDRLIIKATVFDDNFNELHSVTTGIDEVHLSYGLKVDNKGEIYLLKVANTGKLAVVKINSKNEVSAYLTVPSGSTDKVNPKLFIHANHQAYVAYCNLKNEELVGVSIANLDFDKETVEDNHYFRLDKETLARIKGNRIRNGNHFFELAEIEEVNDKLVVIIEQHKIEGVDVEYEPMASEELSHWHHKSTTVVTGNMVVLVYDKELNPLNKFEITKFQKATILDGLNTLGHTVHCIDDKLMFVYSNTTKEITNNELYVHVLDLSDAKLSEPYLVKLPKTHTGLIVSSLVLDKGKLLMQTRKGILGKKNYLGIYEY